MLNFLMSKLKLKNQPIKTRQKLTHKNPPELNQKSARKFNQKKDRLKRRSLKHLHAVLKQDPLFFLSIPVARRPQGIKKKVLLVRNCCKE